MISIALFLSLWAMKVWVTGGAELKYIDNSTASQLLEVPNSLLEGQKEEEEMMLVLFGAGVDC